MSINANPQGSAEEEINAALYRRLKCRAPTTKNKNSNGRIDGALNANLLQIICSTGAPCTAAAAAAAAAIAAATAAAGVAAAAVGTAAQEALLYEKKKSNKLNQANE